MALPVPIEGAVVTGLLASVVMPAVAATDETDEATEAAEVAASEAEDAASVAGAAASGQICEVTARASVSMNQFLHSCLRRYGS